MNDPRIDGLALYAWIGEDETGHFGTKTCVTQLGVMPMVANARRLADQMLPQVALIAEKLGQPMYLVRFKVESVEEVISPSGGKPH